MIVAKMLDDTRPIIAIYWPDGEDLRVGVEGITRIVPYSETGRVWFAIFRGEYLWGRADARGSAVEYAPPEPEVTPP